MPIKKRLDKTIFLCKSNVFYWYITAVPVAVTINALP